MLSAERWMLLVLGAGLLLGFVAQVVGRRAHVPRVTLLLIIGALSGPSAADVVPHEVDRWFPVVSQAALSMVGFTLGQHFRLERFSVLGRAALVVSATEAAVTSLVVWTGLVLAGTPWVLATLVAALGPATDPAAVLDVVREVRARGPVTDTTLDVVAIDDAWGVLLFSVLAVVAHAMGGGGFEAARLLTSLYEVGGAVLLGVVVGLPMAWLTGRLKPGELTLAETLGFVLLVGGLAGYAGVSYLLTSIALGVTVANLARHHERAFHAVEDAMEPLLILFFLLAGYEFRIDQLTSIGWLGSAYLVLRTLGKLAGARLGCGLVGAPTVVRRWLGTCLLPQAGVALGMALMLAERFPEVGPMILSMAVATTVCFELLGPLAVRLALARAGEIPPPETR